MIVPENPYTIYYTEYDEREIMSQSAPDSAELPAEAYQLEIAAMGATIAGMIECPACEGTGSYGGRKNAPTALSMNCMECGGTGKR